MIYEINFHGYILGECTEEIIIQPGDMFLTSYGKIEQETLFYMVTELI